MKFISTAGALGLGREGLVTAGALGLGQEGVVLWAVPLPGLKHIPDLFESPVLFS